MRIWQRQLVAAATIVAAGATAAAQRPTQPALLERATAGVERFVSTFSGIVADEHYEQQRSSPRARRTLHAEFLLVKVPGSSAWHQFRDVIDVDGVPVPGRQQRLLSLFTDPDDSGADPLARAGEVTRLSASHNLADIGSLNLPLNAIALLQRSYRSQFQIDTLRLDPDVADDARVLRFRETGVRPLMSSGNGRPARIDARMWISERSGGVLQTELTTLWPTFPSEITTRFAVDDALGSMVPTEMRERYTLRRGELTGVATYSRFRRFEVRTSERLRPR